MKGSSFLGLFIVLILFLFFLWYKGAFKKFGLSPETLGQDDFDILGDEINTSGSTPQELPAGLSGNNPERALFALDVEVDYPNGKAEVFAQGNGNYFEYNFYELGLSPNTNPNGQYTEINQWNSSDNDFRLVILDYQYYTNQQVLNLGSNEAMLNDLISDHTTYFLLFETKKYMGKLGTNGVDNLPTAHNIANAKKAISVDWLNAKTTILK